jgi:lipoprotein-releasing system ATP-binding protein
VQQAVLNSSVLDLSLKPALTPHDQVLAIEVEGLMKSYRTRGDERIIYENVNFAAQPGELTLIMGESGSGKSTLLRQIALLDPVTKGDIYYFGTNVAGKSISEKAKIRAKQLGFIFQSYALIEEFSVLENCALPLLMNGYNKSAAMAKARDYIQNFICDISADKQPNELSGGEQQRVAVIRALIHQPGIVIADEPTGNLDEKNAEIIKQELVRIAKQLGSAVIIVSHDESFIDCSDAFYQLVASSAPRVKSQLVRIK